MKSIKFFSILLLSALMCACGGNSSKTGSSGESSSESVSNKAFKKDGAMKSGEFSVSPTQKVRFSRGNLQYCPATKVWQFAETQYDYYGDSNHNISDSYNGWIDLFGWGTGNCPTKKLDNGETAGTDYPSFVDWGNNPIKNGGNKAGAWRTLTAEEWGYLFTQRMNAQSLYGSAQVNGVKGLVIFPDRWYTPEGTVFKSGMNGFTLNVYNADQWADMEANGAVFLPAAGDRGGEYVYGVHSKGYYWSGTPYERYDLSAYCLYFDDDYLRPQNICNRLLGFSVRLVQDL